eukprot:TRINITY_DN735_c0_g5_i1.p1 TRINITY_DN735_c0_g5~~TRINITY_DN735_c0_g5_i1.p1  ORF type:complete len:293 (-),score=68.64 TRINITY_DN735_c0_g5_i1:132-1010(-)
MLDPSFFSEKSKTTTEKSEGTWWANRRRVHLDEVLDDLCARFIIGLPQRFLVRGERLMFAIEKCHWFYMDHYRQRFSELPELRFDAMTPLIFHRCPILWPYIPEIKRYQTQFKTYCGKIPTRGAVILDASLTKVLLVQEPWWRKFGFPKGKREALEDDVTAAIRETLEETGFDITPFLVREKRIEVDKSVFYIIESGLDSEGTRFESPDPTEILSVEWIGVNDIGKGPRKFNKIAIDVASILKIWLGGKGDTPKRKKQKVKAVARERKRVEKDEKTMEKPFSLEDLEKDLIP